MESTLIRYSDLLGSHYKKSVLSFAVLCQIYIVLFFLKYGIMPILIIAVSFVILLLTAFSVKRSYYIFAIYFSIFPASHYVANFPMMPFGFILYIGYALFLVIIMYWIIDLINNSRTLSFKAIDIVLLIFLSSMIISTVYGILKGNNTKYLLYDFMTLSLYITFFIFMHSTLRYKPKFFLNFIVICSLIIGIQFLNSLLSFGGIVVLTRIVSGHIHLSQLALAYIGATIIYSSNRRMKIILSLSLPLILFSVLISQQRALWGSTLVVTLILIALFIWQHRDWIRNHQLRIFFILLATTLFVLIAFFVINNLTGGRLHATLISRGFILFNPEFLKFDESARIRFFEVYDAIRDTSNEFIIGKGLGIGSVTRWRLVQHGSIDNSYAYLYWKMGLIGLFSFLSFYILYIVRSLKVLRKSISSDDRIYVISVLLNFIALFIIGFTNVCLVRYRFILLWAASIAIVETIVRKYA